MTAHLMKPQMPPHAVSHRKINVKVYPNLPKPRSYSKSLSVVEMMKLGKLVTKQRTHNITLESFDISDMSWTKEALPVEFVLEEEPLGVGGFRKVLKATSSHPKYSSKQWVIKKYLPEALND